MSRYLETQSALTISELRAYLKASLPDYMVPAAFVQLNELPLTPNGKIDRRALPAMDTSRADLTPEFIAPRAGAERTIAAIWQDVLQVERVGIHDNFFDLGGHSLLVAQAHSRLREAFDVDLSLVDLFTYPTISALASYLNQAPGAERRRKGRSLRPTGERQNTDIAIIGLAGRFPGAASIETFWDNLRQGVESISFFSDDELAAAGVDPSTLADPQYVKARAVLDDADLFDATFFGMTPREAELMDPQQRVFLECAWQALEHAGYDSERYDGHIGVFAGVGVNTYLMHAGRSFVGSAERYQAFIHNDKDFLPTRVSYKLNLRGPSVTVQTACSSSLVAVHMACRSLLSGESSMTLAGGVAIGIPQQTGYFYEAGGIPSPDGHCRAFDAQARGTVFGSGVGIVVLKRLDDALAAGDAIYAVIKGSAINNDGAAKIGYTAPSVEGQAEVIADALAVADVPIETISYIEAHGTGTELGDPIEVAALTQAFRSQTDKTGFCKLGALKTNIGHLDTAAGVAGLIKTVLALRHGQIPPSLNYEQPNPKIDFAGSPFMVNTELTEWRANGTPRRAGVSSFGIGGTNAHVVLEEAPATADESPARPWQLLVFSAKTATALETVADQLAAHLRQHPEQSPADVAYTLQVGRRRHKHRQFLVCCDAEDAAQILATRDPRRLFGQAQEPQPQAVVYMFSGQGSQYVNMGRDLYDHEPSFRAQIDRCCELLIPHLGRDLRTLLYPDVEDIDAAVDALRQTALTQPALFVVEYALAQLWMEWGVRPQALIGHSVGEYVAACLAGVFTLEDALALVAARGRMMQDAPPGAMLSVALSPDAIQPLLGAPLDLAAINGPEQCVIAGAPDAIDALQERLTAQGTPCRQLQTSHAFHSALMESLVEPFAALVSKMTLRPPQIPFVSNVTGGWISADEATDPRYWARHLRVPVRFADGLNTLLATPDQMLLEVGPGNALTTLARQHATQPTTIASLRHPREQQDDVAFLLNSVGRLWMNGVEIDWAAFHQREQRRRVPLPTYPFERRRYWLEPRAPIQADQTALQRKPDLADWFVAPIWKQSVPLLPATSEQLALRAQRWLVFADSCGLGERLARQLRASGQEVTLAQIGRTFSRIDENVVSVNPCQAGDYDTLLNELRDNGKLPDIIVHLWSVTSAGLLDAERETPTDVQALGFESLMLLAQALGRSAGDASLRIAIVSNGMQSLAGEAARCPEKATLLGPCQVIPQEYPNITCQSIDGAYHGMGEQLDDLADQLISECVAPVDDTVIAYRGVSRWTQTFEPLRLPEPSTHPARLREGGVYLITGGLGGIGLTLAEYLAQTTRAKLALLGRAALPEPAEWEQWLATHGADDPTSRKIRAIQAIQAHGAEVMTIGADVADPAQMERAIGQVYARFGALHGVIHAAGVPGGGMIQRKSLEQAAEVLKPKVYGTLVLHALLRDAQLDFFILCSSINAIIGGFGQIDYCAANAFLDAFAASKTSRRGTFVVALNWDRWQEIGMAVETQAPEEFRKIQGLPAGAAPHPLLDACILETAEKVVYRTDFAVARHWALAEHLIAGSPTVPGTTYLEMARAAFEQITRQRRATIRDVVFIAPLVVRAAETRETLTILEQSGDTYTFRIISRAGGEDDNTWSEHARGVIEAVDQTAPKQHDLAPILARCRPIAVDSLTNGVEHNGSAFLEAGPRWQTLRQVARGADEGIAVLSLDDSFAADLERYVLHPALLDVAAGAVKYLGEGNYLPLAYEQVYVSGALPATIYSHIIYRAGGHTTKETLTCDILITDERGQELVAVKGFSMKRLSAEMIATLRRAADALPPQRSDTTPTDRPIAQASTANLLDDGIRPQEGVQAFARVLSGVAAPQLIISPRDIHATIKEAQAFTRSQIIERLEQIDIPRTMHARPNLANPYIAPSNDTERRIAEIWQRMLGIEQVGVHDNFFELGGTSLSAIQILAELKKALNVDIPAVSIFEAPTVSLLAAYVLVQNQPASFDHAVDRAKKKDAALARQRRAREVNR